MTFWNIVLKSYILNMWKYQFNAYIPFPVTNDVHDFPGKPSYIRIYITTTIFTLLDFANNFEKNAFVSGAFNLFNNNRGRWRDMLYMESSYNQYLTLFRLLSIFTLKILDLSNYLLDDARLPGKKETQHFILNKRL